MLDLDHLGAEVREPAAGERPRDQGAQLEDPKVRQRPEERRGRSTWLDIDPDYWTDLSESRDEP